MKTHNQILEDLNQMVHDLEPFKITAEPKRVCVSAGGYWRDITMGRPVKDLDIFIPFIEGDVKSTAAAIGIYLGCSVKPMNGSIQISYSDVEVQAVFDTDLLEADYGVPVQVIMLRKNLAPVDRIGSFDFGLCQFANNGVVSITPYAATEDQVHKQFTLVNCENQQEFDRSMRRYHRLTSEKYQGFPLVIPEEFQDYYQAWLATSNTYTSGTNTR